MAGRRTDEQARATRAAILERAVELVSVRGFEGLTIGALASELDMSKAGILGHFQTKETLQLAAHDEAARVFRERVFEPAQAAKRGLPRLREYCERWSWFIEDSPWPGGCVLTAASFEFDDRQGAVTDVLREGALQWKAAIARQAQLAIDQGELSDTHGDGAQLAFVIVALATGAIQSRQLHRDPECGVRLRRAYGDLLGPPVVAVATKSGT